MRAFVAEVAAERRASALLAGWQRFWFRPVSAGPLGFCRVLFFAYMLVHLAPRADSTDWSQIDPAFWSPIHLFAALRLSAAPASILRALDLIWLLALLLSCLGLLTRVSTGVALLVGVYVLGLPQCFGKVDHWSGLLIVAMLVLALARSGDAWSIDAWIAARRGRRQGAGSTGPSFGGEYRWPVQLIRLTMTLVFFAAGVSKLRFAGITWFEPDNMAAILIQPHYAIDRSLPPLGLLLAGSPTATTALAAAAVLAEIAAPLALLGGLPAVLIVSALFGMQLGSAVLLGVHASFPYLACYAFWVPWGSLRGRLARADAALW